MRKVTLPAGSHHGGLLTMGSVLKVTANRTTISAIIRGYSCGIGGGDSGNSFCQKKAPRPKPGRFEFPPVPSELRASYPKGDEVGADEQGCCLPVKA